MMGAKFRGKFLSWWTLVCGIVGFMVVGACTREDRGAGTSQGTGTTDISSVTQNEQAEVLQLQDIALGEVGLVSDTELDPNLIEASLQEADILTARAPLYVKEENIDETKIREEIINEFNYEQVLTGFVSGEVLWKLRNLESKIKYAEKLGDKYSFLVRELLSGWWLLDCYKQGKMQGSNQCFSQRMNNCEIKITGCTLKDYSVSGTIYVSLDGEPSKNNYSFSVSVATVELTKGDKKIKFNEGLISGEVRIDLTSETGNVSIRVQNLKVIDTEEGIKISGTIKDDVQISSYSLSITRTLENIIYEKDGKTFTLESGKIMAEGKKSSPNNILVKLEGIKFRSSDGESLLIDGSFKKEVSKDPKFVMREISSKISFSSSTTSFSAEFYRYKKVQKDKTGNDKIFALSITNYVKVNDRVVRSYSHNLTVVKEGPGEFEVSGEIKVVRKDGTEIQINLNNVKLVKDCRNPTLGNISSVIKKDGKVIKVNVTLSQNCSCEHKVEVEKDGKLIKSTGDICEAKKKAETGALSDMMGKEIEHHHHGEDHH